MYEIIEDGDQQTARQDSTRPDFEAKESEEIELRQTIFELIGPWM